MGPSLPTQGCSSIPPIQILGPLLLFSFFEIFFSSLGSPSYSERKIRVEFPQNEMDHNYRRGDTPIFLCSPPIRHKCFVNTFSNGIHVIRL